MIAQQRYVNSPHCARCCNYFHTCRHCRLESATTVYFLHLPLVSRSRFSSNFRALSASNLSSLQLAMYNQRSGTCTCLRPKYLRIDYRHRSWRTVSHKSNWHELCCRMVCNMHRLVGGGVFPSFGGVFRRLFWISAGSFSFLSSWSGCNLFLHVRTHIGWPCWPGLGAAVGYVQANYVICR